MISFSKIFRAKKQEEKSKRRKPFYEIVKEENGVQFDIFTNVEIDMDDVQSIIDITIAYSAEKVDACITAEKICKLLNSRNRDVNAVDINGEGGKGWVIKLSNHPLEFRG